MNTDILGTLWIGLRKNQYEFTYIACVFRLISINWFNFNSSAYQRKKKGIQMVIKTFELSAWQQSYASNQCNHSLDTIRLKWNGNLVYLSYNDHKWYKFVSILLYTVTQLL